jgi:hypothetical protein
MMRKTLGGIVIALFTVAPAQGKARPKKEPRSEPAAATAKVAGSCDQIRAAQRCFDFPAIEDDKVFRATCAMVGAGVPRKEACPTAGVIGTCDKGDSLQRLYFVWGDAAWATEHAKQSCEFQHGKFTAAENPTRAAFPGMSKVRMSCDTRKTTDTCTETMEVATEWMLSDNTDKECGTDVRTTTKPCPKEGVLGSCDKRDGSVQRYYKGEMAYTEASAKEDCEGSNSGVWLGSK